jgi:uracil-DNA glycosylase
MSLEDLENEIYNCPYSNSIQCSSRFHSHPIPGYGSEHPRFLVLGINPALRRGIWQHYDSQKDTLQEKYYKECINPQYSYGRFLNKLEEIIPEFEIPETVYLSDIVRCPVNNGNPTQSMLEQCKTAYLEKTIHLLQPEFIITLGNKATRLLSGHRRKDKKTDVFELSFRGKKYWQISAPHPSRAVNIDDIVEEIRLILNSPKENTVSKPKKISRNKIEAQNRLINELFALGYTKQKNNVLVRDNKVVTFSCSSEYDSYRMAVFWKEHWKQNYAHIYDYWAAGGPTCIVPIETLFANNFIQKKKKLPSHDNNPYYYKGKQYYWWRQKVKKEHELARLILKFKDRWDLLK